MDGIKLVHIDFIILIYIEPLFNDQMMMQSNCKWRTCSRSLYTVAVSEEKDWKHIPHYKAIAETNQIPWPNCSNQSATMTQLL